MSLIKRWWGELGYFLCAAKIYYLHWKARLRKKQLLHCTVYQGNKREQLFWETDKSLAGAPAYQLLLERGPSYRRGVGEEKDRETRRTMCNND